MFNLLLSIPQLSSLTLFSFFVLITIRLLFIKRISFIFLYHICLFCTLSVLSIGGGGVQNEGYRQLEEFILLEKNHQLEQVINNPQKIYLDLERFKTSDELKAYLRKWDISVDRSEAVTIGWLFVLLTEVSMVLVKLINFISHILKHKKKI